MARAQSCRGAERNQHPAPAHFWITASIGIIIFTIALAPGPLQKRRLIRLLQCQKAYSQYRYYLSSLPMEHDKDVKR